MSWRFFCGDRSWRWGLIQTASAEVVWILGIPASVLLTGKSAVQRNNPAHLVTVRFESIGVVNDPVANGVGQRGIAERAVPVLDLELAGDDGASLVVPVVEDIEQIACEPVGEVHNAHIVQDQHIGFRELLQQGRAALQGMGFVELFGEFRHAVAAYSVLG